MTGKPPVQRPAGPARWRRLWPLALLLAAGGCQDLQLTQLRGELRQHRQQNEQLTRQVVRLEQDLRARDEHIRDLQALGPKRLEKLFYVTGISLGHTGGVNLDKVGGDDAVRVYIKPVDHRGHIIKAAGSATIQLFDLAAEPAGNLMGEYELSVDEMAERWCGGFVTQHYRIDCPWKSGPPANADLTVRVVFQDYLTGKKFTAQKLVTVALAPTTQPAE